MWARIAAAVKHLRHGAPESAVPRHRPALVFAAICDEVTTRNLRMA